MQFKEANLMNFLRFSRSICFTFERQPCLPLMFGFDTWVCKNVQPFLCMMIASNTASVCRSKVYIWTHIYSGTLMQITNTLLTSQAWEVDVKIVCCSFLCFWKSWQSSQHGTQNEQPRVTNTILKLDLLNHHLKGHQRKKRTQSSLMTWSSIVWIHRHLRRNYRWRTAVNDVEQE